MNPAPILLVLGMLIEVACLVRVITRPNRDPASRVAWVVVIAVLPLLGIFAYLLLGETNIGRKRVRRMKEVIEGMPAIPSVPEEDQVNAAVEIPKRFESLFCAGRSVNHFDAVGGNSGTLMADSNAAIDSMIADIDAAQEHVHLSFYIWLSDHNGLKMVEALKRAAARGVTCRAMADDLGSRAMIRSTHWQDMRQAGVHLAVALPIGNPLMKPFRGRLDLRNHRKVLVIDDRVTYCGSQNCADPEFRVKAKFAPWVDAMIRFQGPVVRQNQYLFVSDWMTYVDENLDEMLTDPVHASRPGFPAQVIATGPTMRSSAMPEMFSTLFFNANDALTITSPYFVPDESIQHALCAAALRGVPTRIVFPARNDSWIVAGASRSYYQNLLESGVEIFEYTKGLLHTKSVTLDGEITLIGSANMDRRSFDLNFENNILFHDKALTADVLARQEQYINDSVQVTKEQVEAWPLHRRLWNNSLATLGPIL